MLLPEELKAALDEEKTARQQAEEKAILAQQQVEQLKERLRELGVDPDTI